MPLLYLANETLLFDFSFPRDMSRAQTQCGQYFMSEVDRAGYKSLLFYTETCRPFVLADRHLPISLLYVKH